MKSYAIYQLLLVNERNAAWAKEAENNRRFGRRAPSIRRAVGTSIIRLGTRLAGEPTYELARFR